MEKDEILVYLTEQINSKKSKEKQIFLTAQIINWSGIVVSFFTVVIAFLDINKWATGTAAGLSTTLILIDKSFFFNERCKWNADYWIKLSQLKRDSMKKDADIEKIIDRLTELEFEKEKTFPYPYLRNDI